MEELNGLEHQSRFPGRPRHVVTVSFNSGVPDASQVEGENHDVSFLQVFPFESPTFADVARNVATVVDVAKQRRDALHVSVSIMVSNIGTGTHCAAWNVPHDLSRPNSIRRIREDLLRVAYVRS